jgi:hypothetical protein
MEVFKLLGVNAKGLGIKNKDDAIRIIIQELDKGVSISEIKQVGILAIDLLNLLN